MTAFHLLQDHHMPFLSLNQVLADDDDKILNPVVAFSSSRYFPHTDHADMLVADTDLYLLIVDGSPILHGSEEAPQNIFTDNTLNPLTCVFIPKGEPFRLEGATKFFMLSKNSKPFSLKYRHE